MKARRTQRKKVQARIKKMKARRTLRTKIQVKIGKMKVKMTQMKNNQIMKMSKMKIVLIKVIQIKKKRNNFILTNILPKVKVNSTTTIIKGIYILNLKGKENIS